MQYTLNLKSLLKNYSDKLSPTDFTRFENHINSQIQEYVDLLNTQEPGIRRGQLAHALIDEEISAAIQRNLEQAIESQTSPLKISCKSGCSGCCRFKIEITNDESKIINRHLESIFKGSPDSRIEWNKNKSTTPGTCFFLSLEGQCRIYDSRPASCRRLLVSSDPKDCTDINGHPVSLVVPQIEVVLSALLNLEDNKRLWMSDVISAFNELNLKPVPQDTLEAYSQI